MQPSEPCLNSLGFLKDFLDLPLLLSHESVFLVANDFLDLPLLLSHESVFLVANASSVLFINSQVLAHAMASGHQVVHPHVYLSPLVSSSR